MQALKLTALRQLKWCETPDPTIKNPDDVLLQTAVVGVCGSDVHYYKTGRIGSQVVKYPFSLGHEPSAVVKETGPAVKNLRPGDHIAVEPAMPCGKCDQCFVGRPHTCRKLRFLGCPGQAEGSLAELLVMPAGSCLKLPDNVSLEQAALAEPLTIGLYAARLALPLKGAGVGILGCGPIGLSCLKAAQLLGAVEVFATDPLAYRANIAGNAGASWAGDPQELVAKVKSAVPGGLDVMFECSGEQTAVDQALELIRPGGRLMLVGIPPSANFILNSDKARRKEVRVLNVRRQCACAQDTLKLMGAGLLKADFMITHRFTAAQAAEAFALVAGYAGGVVKAMINLVD